MDDRFIETCPCPVLLLKTTRPYGKGVVIAAIDPALARKRPADLDSQILEAAIALSRGLSAPLHVFHACAPWTRVVDDASELRRVPALLRPEVHELYLKCTDARIAELARRHGLPGDRIHVAEGGVSESLPPFARSLAADVVVMGAVARSRLQRTLIGHSAERVLDSLEADLLIVKPPSFRSPVAPGSVHRLPKGEARRAKYIF